MHDKSAKIRIINAFAIGLLIHMTHIILICQRKKYNGKAALTSNCNIICIHKEKSWKGKLRFENSNFWAFYST